MNDILEYYVMRNGDVTMWLDADEQTWTAHFGNAASFDTAELANEIAKRELGDDRVYYVMGCMASDPGDED